jgi:hypothetical protein
LPVRGLIRLALTAAEGALDASLTVVRLVRGLVEDDAEETRWSVADTPPAEPAAPVREPAPPREPPVRGPAPPPVPAAEEHVSEEPVPVAEFAEAGAEDGAGAELTIEEPWEGYAQQDSRTIVRELAGASREALAAVELYESTHKRRSSVSAAAERRLKALSGPAAPRTR